MLYISGDPVHVATFVVSNFMHSCRQKFAILYLNIIYLVIPERALGECLMSPDLVELQPVMESALEARYI